MKHKSAVDSAKMLCLETAIAPLVVVRAGESPAHRAIKYASAVWAWCKGFRSVGTEVVMASGTIDAAAIGELSVTNARAVMLGLPTRHKRRVYSVLIEAKATRADFLSDMKSVASKYPHLSLPAMNDLIKYTGGRAHGAGKFERANVHGDGNARYVAAPKGMIKPSEVPEGWGLLEFDAGVLRVTVKAKFHAADASHARIAINIGEAWARNVFLRPLREMSKELRAQRRARLSSVKAKEK